MAGPVRHEGDKLPSLPHEGEYPVDHLQIAQKIIRADIVDFSRAPLLQNETYCTAVVTD